MRRLRDDLPYTFRPPKLQGWLRPLGLGLNRAVHLSRKYRIATGPIYPPSRPRSRCWKKEARKPNTSVMPGWGISSSRPS